MKRQPSGWEKIIANETDKGLIFKIYLKNICTPMVTVALFTKAKALKQPKWPTEEWIKKMRYK